MGMSSHRRCPFGFRKTDGQLWLRLIHRGLSSFQIRVELLLPDRTPLSAAETEALLVTAGSFSLFFSLAIKENEFLPPREKVQSAKMQLAQPEQVRRKKCCLIPSYGFPFFSRDTL